MPCSSSGALSVSLPTINRLGGMTINWSVLNLDFKRLLLSTNLLYVLYFLCKYYNPLSPLSSGFNDSVLYISIARV